MGMTDKCAAVNGSTCIPIVNESHHNRTRITVARSTPFNSEMYDAVDAAGFIIQLYTLKQEKKQSRS